MAQQDDGHGPLLIEESPVLHRGRAGEVRTEQCSPLGEQIGIPEALHVVLDRVPADGDEIGSRAFDAAMQVNHPKPGRSRHHVPLLARMLPRTPSWPGRMSM